MWRVAWVRVSAGENAHVIIVRWPHGDASRAETPPDTTSMLPRITHRPPRIRKCRLGCIQRAWGTGLTATAGSLTLTLTRVLSLKPRCSNSLCPPASVRSLSWALRHSNRMLELAQWRRGRGCAGGLTAAYVSRTCHWVMGRMLNAAHARSQESSETPGRGLAAEGPLLRDNQSERRLGAGGADSGWRV